MTKHIITYEINGVKHRHVTEDDYKAWVAINDAKMHGAENIGMHEEETSEKSTL